MSEQVLPPSFAEALSPDILLGIGQVAKESLDWSGELEPGSSLVPALDLDSLRLMTLVVALEDHFKVCLEDGDEDELDTVADLARLLERRIGEQKA